jgi:uncharacterized LabA/DUF88 family protein
MTESEAAAMRPERIMIFVDFWNYELSTKEAVPGFKTDWGKLAPEIMHATKSLLSLPNGADYAGMRVYGSYSPVTETSLHRWATTVLKRYPGVFTEWSERQRQVKGPVCPSCKAEIPVCPACGRSMLGFKEKGVDTRIATDMIRFAWEDSYDTAVLVSADRDYIPVVNFLDSKGKRIIHGIFPPKGQDLSRSCWGSVQIPPLMPRFQRA